VFACYEITHEGPLVSVVSVSQLSKGACRCRTLDDAGDELQYAATELSNRAGKSDLERISRLGHMICP
jgi:hypothetical protein